MAECTESCLFIAAGKQQNLEYICLNHGTIHKCGVLCNRQVYDDKYNLICKFTKEIIKSSNFESYSEICNEKDKKGKRRVNNLSKLKSKRRITNIRNNKRSEELPDVVRNKIIYLFKNKAIVDDYNISNECALLYNYLKEHAPHDQQCSLEDFVTGFFVLSTSKIEFEGTTLLKQSRIISQNLNVTPHNKKGIFCKKSIRIGNNYIKAILRQLWETDRVNLLQFCQQFNKTR